MEEVAGAVNWMPVSALPRNITCGKSSVVTEAKMIIDASGH